ncbi:MAG: glucans biosynthesis glucosyltransferase MdoH, partial [Rhodovibrionaceae bacterium]
VHFFVLSDSSDPRCWLEEERIWLDTRDRLGARGRLFYRRRETNAGRKPGNIADFCRRWGGAYDYMVVLDADSLMAGATLMELVRRMEAEPRAGLIQTWPRPVHGATLFARVQQYAAAISGPLIVGGMAALAGRAGNYWGHNAIVRTRAFVESCGLPSLPGKPPLGGEIMSHDFVEAALLVRNGWHVRLDADLAGSYEEGPPNLIESLRRDRRWCQGNLQHLRILPAGGLHPVSRINLAIGIMSFLSAPIWLIFVMLAIAEALSSTFFERLAELSLTMAPNHGAIGAQLLAQLLQDSGTLNLLGLSAILLLGPKLLGIVTTLLDGAKRRLQGGGLRILFSSLLETAVSALVAPLTMLAHSRFIVEILLGRSVGWGAQQRDAARVSWPEAWQAFAWLVVSGLAVAALSTRVIPEVFWWLSPVLISAGLAEPLTLLTGRRSVGDILARLGILRIPEESAAPDILRRFEAWPRAGGTPIQTAADLAEAVRHAPLLSLHRALTPRSGLQQQQAQIAATLSRARATGAATLSLDDWRLLLANPDSLADLSGSTTT